jgi:ribosomal-protein-alanine N-acetyltransferase
MKRLSALFRTADRIDISDGYHLTVIDHPDAINLVKYLDDKDIFKTTCSIPHPYTIEDADKFITTVLAFEKKNKVQRDWAIRSKSGALIGGIGLLYNHGIKSHRSEIGYWLAKPFWNMGLMSKVVSGFSDHILHTTGIMRLEAQVFEDNQASGRVLEKAGFVKEGFLEKAVLKEGVYIGVNLYGKVRVGS